MDSASYNLSHHKGHWGCEKIELNLLPEYPKIKTESFGQVQHMNDKLEKNTVTTRKRSRHARTVQSQAVTKTCLLAITAPSAKVSSFTHF